MKQRESYQIRPVGGSMVITIPAKIVQQFGFIKGDEMTVRCKGKAIIIERLLPTTAAAHSSEEQEAGSTVEGLNDSSTGGAGD